MLGFHPLGFLPIGQATDDGIHGEISASAAELDQADAALVYVVEIDGIDIALDLLLRRPEIPADLWARFLRPGGL